MRIKVSTTSVNPPQFEVLGLVNGLQVRSLNIFRQFLTGVASIFGTGTKDWTGVKDKFDKAREEALGEMIQNALKMGADEVIGTRIDVSEISAGKDNDGMLIVAAYGTAIKYRNNKKNTNNVSRKNTNKVEQKAGKNTSVKRN